MRRLVGYDACIMARVQNGQIVLNESDSKEERTTGAQKEICRVNHIVQGHSAIQRE